MEPLRRTKLGASMDKRRHASSSEPTHVNESPADRAHRELSERLGSEYPEFRASQDIFLRPVHGTFSKCVRPRYVNFESMEDFFPGLTEMFDFQGWVLFMSAHKSVCHASVLEMCNNMSEFHDEDDRKYIYTWVKGIFFQISPSLLAKVLDLPDEGVLEKDFDYSPDKLHYYLTGTKVKGIASAFRYSANDLTPRARVVHHMLTTILHPRDGGRDQVTITHKFFLYCLFKKVKINLAQSMYELIHQLYYFPNCTVPYAPQLSTFFSKLELNPDKIILFPLSKLHAYNKTSMKRMGFKLVKGKVVRTAEVGSDDEDADAEGAIDAVAEGEPIAQPIEEEDDDSSSSGSLLDGQFSMRAMTEFLEDRFVQMERSMTRHFDARFNDLKRHMLVLDAKFDSLATHCGYTYRAGSSSAAPTEDAPAAAEEGAPIDLPWECEVSSTLGLFEFFSSRVHSSSSYNSLLRR